MRAKKAKEILFVKVRADGFGLGAQRQSIAENDLPEAQRILSAWKREKKLESSEIALYAAKNKIAEDGEYNLTAERYRAVIDYSHVKLPIVKLGEICNVLRGESITKAKVQKGNIPVVAGGRGPAYYHNKANRTGDIITISGSGAYAGFVNYFQGQIFASDCSTVQSSDKERILTKFVYFCLRYKQKEIYQLRTGMAQPHVYPKNIQGFSIPLPPLAVQEEIVAELDGYQRVIDGARLAIANWKPTININPDWPTLKLGQMCVFNRGVTYSKKDEVHESGIKILRANNINVKSNKLDFSEIRVISKDVKVNPKQMLRAEDILICTASGSKEHLGKVAYTHKDTEFYFGGFMGCIRASEMINARYLFFNLSSKRFRELIQNKAPGVNIQNLKFSDISDYDIPLPPLDEQQRIVAEVAEEEKAIAACRCLIDSHEQKIRAKIAALWGEK